jgi:pimeloyl-[acyl-carrier protein] methyl ester esterase
MSRLNVEVAGRGPDLVLLHGWGLNLGVWDGLVQEIGARFRVISIDLPGHGRSAWNAGRSTPAEMAWQIHDTLSSVSNRYCLLGWSLGGQIALDLAAAMPSRVERLVLVATTAKFASAPDWPHGMPAATLTRLAGKLRTDSRRTMDDFLKLQVRGGADSENVLGQLRNALSTHGEAQPEALSAGLNMLAASDLRATLPHVRLPVLVIAGQHDRITPAAASRALTQLLPDARYIEIRRAAHVPFLSHPKLFAKWLQSFLRPARTEKRRPKRMRAKRRVRARTGKPIR